MKIHKFASHLMVGACAVLALSCSDDDTNNNNITIPETYSFERAGQTTVSFSGQSTRIAMGEELLAALNDQTSTVAQLQAMYDHAVGDNDFSDSELNGSSKNMKSKTAASSDYFSMNTAVSAEIKADFDSWLDAQVTEVFVNADQAASVGQAGQIADGSSTRYVSAKGLEYNQMFNKSMIGALMTDQILNNYVSTSVLDAGSNVEDNDAEIVDEGKNYTAMEHKWDEAYGYVYGASVDPANPNATIGQDDNFLNKYIGRVEGDEDFTGIADEIFEAFLTGRAAIVAGDYELRDDQAEIIREKISEVVGIRAVYYLQSGKTGLEAQDFGGAFHDLSEGAGFVYSLQFTRKPGTSEPYLTKSEVDGFLEGILGTDDGFWSVSSTTLDQISEAIAAEFDFTVDEAAN